MDFECDIYRLMFANLPWTRDDESRGKHTGTFGEVHVWRRIRNGAKEMAVVKIPTVPQHIEKLRKERDKMLQVSHENIVRCLNPSIFSDDFNLDRQYKSGIIWKDVLVMEFCDGGNLRKIFNQNKHGVRLDDLFNICSDLGSALQYLHEVHHIIHRDIKPENIFLSKTTDSTRPLLYKIGDMGEVTEVMKSDGMTHVSTLQTHGTFAYMAPEQLLYDPYDGTMKMGESTDLWGFGTILSEAAFGIRPFFHDQGHHIHMDISSYCSTIMDKSDETIYIYKEGQMRDPTFLPVHSSVIPHNSTLPDFVLQRIYQILRSALLSDRKKRGNYSNGSYGIYKMITDLTSTRICSVLHCGQIKSQFIDFNNEERKSYDTSNGIIVDQNLEINPEHYDAGLYLYLTEFSESSISIPSIPNVLEQYFSEPFPSYRKGVERSLVGFVVSLRLKLEHVVKSIEIIIKLIEKTKTKFEAESLAPFSTFVELCDHKLYRGYLMSCIETISTKTVVDNLQDLMHDIIKQIEYTTCWVDTFRGLTSKTEWTDVYLLVDCFKEKYCTLVNRFAKASGSGYSFLKTVAHHEMKLNGMAAEMKGIVLKTSGNNSKDRKSNIALLMEENAKLFDQLKIELEDNFDI